MGAAGQVSRMGTSAAVPYTLALEGYTTRQYGADVRTYSSTWAVVATVRSKSAMGSSMEKETEPPPAQWTMTAGSPAYCLSVSSVTSGDCHSVRPPHLP